MNTKLAHPMIWQTAVAMAHSMYDDLMMNNSLYAMWKKQCPELTPKELEARFVAQMAPKLLEQARATLAKLLGRPGNEGLKPAISDALIADATVRIGRKTGSGLRI